MSTYPLIIDSLHPESKRPLIPVGINKSLKTYACGITPYTLDSHMGHLRVMVTIDILLRILENYFKYNIFHVMNVTDIDDKIIRGASEQYKPLELKHVEEFVKVNELRFHEDMHNFGVLKPAIVPRVTEHISEIIAFVKKILDNGFGYIGKNTGSIYFDSIAFVVSGGNLDKFSHSHDSHEDDNDDLHENEDKEGDEILLEKKKSIDFALMKKPRDGDISWDTPWGKLKPGWHIECTAMASHLLFKTSNVESKDSASATTFDIHFGGEDLKSIHHRAEVLQAEAVYGINKPWVNHFIHIGHLNIAGRKMSKSLKNFITIREAQSRYTPRQLRLFFLMHPWYAKINYSDDGMKEVISAETYLSEFFDNIQSHAHASLLPRKWTENEWKLQSFLDECKASVHKHLMDNLNYVAVVQELISLIKHANTYINILCKITNVNFILLEHVKSYIHDILTMFGLPSFTVGATSTSTTTEKDLTIKTTLAKFRSRIRNIAMDSKHEKINDSILKECDVLRNEEFPKLGTRLEDLPNGEFKLKPLRIDAQDHVNMDMKEKKKIESTLVQREKDIRKWTNAHLTVEEWFNSLNKYDNFNQDGFPTTDKEGKQLSKSAIKVIQKELVNFTLVSSEYKKLLIDDPHFLTKKQQEIEQLKIKLL